jgi:hypothetical protein
MSKNIKGPQQLPYWSRKTDANGSGRRPVDRGTLKRKFLDLFTWVSIQMFLSGSPNAPHDILEAQE